MTSMCQVSIRRGAARSWDHAQLVHEQWLHAALNCVEISVKRVATDDNIADLPSRSARNAIRRRSHPVVRTFVVQEFQLLRDIGAVEWVPYLKESYEGDKTWEVLRERWCL